MVKILTIRDHKKNEHPLISVKTVTEDLNSNPVLELKIPKQNNLDLKLIDKLWEINYQTVDYKIMYVKQVTKGDNFYLDVRAIPLFYWDFDKQIVHENKDGHYTGTNAFTDLFNGTGYQYVLVDFVEAIQIEGFGKGETRLEMFKRLIERFGLEFYIVGKTVYLKKLIGNDTNFQYRYKLNASNVSKSIDASNYFTHIKGFGNFEEGSENYLSDAKLKREYTSPLASVLGLYEGKPIVDGRIKDTATMDSNLKRAVEESLEISIEGNLHDVRSIYAEAVPTIGDRVFLIDERIDLEQEIRIHTLKRTYDVHDKLIDCEVTFGSQNIRDRYKSNLNSAAKDFTALMKGDIKLPTWSLDEIARGMITKIHASENELKYGSFGIQAIDKNNPNNVFGLNSQGWYISTDGGKTARTIATAEGIVADAIHTGTLRAITIEGVEIYGSLLESRNGSNVTTIRGGYLKSSGNYTRTWFDVTENASVELSMENGYFMARNRDSGKRLVYSDKGISTFIHGYSDEDDNYEYHGSGVIEFFSHQFDKDVRGLTLFSNRGTIGLKTLTRDIVLDSDRNITLSTNRGYVDFKLLDVNRVGNNHFQMYVHNNPNPSDTDGLLRYGSPNTDYASGIRFEKTSAGSYGQIWITDGTGAKGSGKLLAGAIEVLGGGILDSYNIRSNRLWTQTNDSFIYLGSDLGVRVTSRGTNNGSITYRDVTMASLHTHGSFQNHSGANYVYFGVGSSTGLRITNNAHYNGGDISWRDIEFRNWKSNSHEKYKEDISEWNFNVLDLFRNELQLYQYKYRDDLENNMLHRGIVLREDSINDKFPAEWRQDDGYNGNEVMWWTVKGVQELAHENEELKSRIGKLEEIIYATR